MTWNNTPFHPLCSIISALKEKICVWSPQKSSAKKSVIAPGSSVFALQAHKSRFAPLPTLQREERHRMPSAVRKHCCGHKEMETEVTGARAVAGKVTPAGGVTVASGTKESVKGTFSRESFAC